VRRLQSALFGGVYEAKGLSSGRDFAIKVLHKSELSKAQETSSIEFCEVPLSEIHFAELMRGDEHVMEAEEHFEDMYCYYVVFDLCRGGDLLEALKQKPHGFDEAHAQFLMRQAAKGLAYLHRRRVAMQDVSLENMLLHINETNGHYQVKVCDPGQAVIFEMDQNGEELPVGFRGLVGKSFRPPELHEQKPYQATKVDSWCLGWSTFYLLTAQPLFMSADPQQQDADWLLFQQGEYHALFQQKSNLCSQRGLDFIFRLLQLEPSRRMSVADALEHAWLTDPKILPVLAPKELLPESLRKQSPNKKDAEDLASPEKKITVGSHSCPASGSTLGSGPGPSARDDALAGGSCPQAGAAGPGVAPLVGSSGHELPTWAAATVPSYGSLQSPTLRVRSPMRPTRASAVASSPRIPVDRDRRRGQPLHPGAATRSPYVIATVHSPPPSMGQLPRPAFLTPRAASRPKVVGIVASPLAQNAKVESSDGDKRLRDRAWAFRADGAAADCQKHVGGDAAPYVHGRHVQSPTRSHGMVYAPRSSSPVQAVEGAGSANIPVRAALRTPSPVAGVTHSAGGFSWTQAPATYSPRAAPGLVASTTTRPASPFGAVSSPVGFAWSPEPPSPRTSPRGFSPTVPGAYTFAKVGQRSR